MNGFLSAFEDDELFQELYMTHIEDENIKPLTQFQQIEDDPNWLCGYGV